VRAPDWFRRSSYRSAPRGAGPVSAGPRDPSLRPENEGQPVLRLGQRLGQRLQDCIGGGRFGGTPRPDFGSGPAIGYFGALPAGGKVASGFAPGVSASAGRFQGLLPESPVFHTPRDFGFGPILRERAGSQEPWHPTCPTDLRIGSDVFRDVALDSLEPPSSESACATFGSRLDRPRATVRDRAHRTGNGCLVGFGRREQDALAVSLRFHPPEDLVGRPGPALRPKSCRGVLFAGQSPPRNTWNPTAAGVPSSLGLAQAISSASPRSRPAECKIPPGSQGRQLLRQ
jgi:hypothetical protein